MKLNRKNTYETVFGSDKGDEDKLDLDDDNDFKDDNFNDDKLDDDLKMDDDFLDAGMGDDYGGGSISPVEKHTDLLKELTNFDPYLKETFNNWLGITWNEEENKFLPNPLLKPMMSRQGAAWCSGLLKTYARKNNIITDISQREYEHIMLDHIEAVWLNLGTRDDLGVFDDGDLIRACNELEHATALILMGAGDGKYNKFLGTTYSHHTNAAQNQGSPGGPVAKKPGAMEKVRSFLVGPS